ncbi:MAG: putative terminase small subunit [Prokaryotic dsDNA virus sp.]|nr:MAG: putative terminase small subunit [Prokaryotic dsDNA virus sp.]|tara:strand:+ start:19231 stop:19719 length:489 start_codon:yes stop_codon:yes gene_type:complete
MTDLTQKQEAFALAYVETGNAAEAYRRAYDVAPDARDSWIYVEACQLLDHPKVSQRVEAAQAEAARLSMFTIKAAFDEYEEARQLAIKASNPSAAVSAVTGKVKLFGLEAPTRSRVDHRSPDGSMTPAPAAVFNLSGLSDKELAQYERLSDKASIPGGVGKA